MNTHFFVVLIASTLLLVPQSSFAVEKTETPSSESPLAPSTKGDFNSVFTKEIERRESYKEKFYVLSEVQKEKSVAKAVQYHRKGRSLFDAGNSKMAQKYYEKAISLNPFINLYYYELAISAYRNAHYLRSLVLLEIVKGTEINETEISYYQALNTMKMKDTELALRKFGYIVEENDPDLSPSSAMYMGMLYRQNGNLDAAKASFQTVLDTSKDANLDLKAEAQIEQIIAAQQFQELSQKRFAYTVFTGFIYDSNVLNIADNNSSLDLAAYRLMYGGSFEYKLVHKEKHSWTPRLTASDIYSVDTSLDSDATTQSTDPLQAELALPYAYQFSLGKKPASLMLIPLFSQIYMSLDEQSRDLIYSTYGLGTVLTTNYGKNWINSTRFDYANDTFHPDTDPDNDQTATKYGLTLSNVRLFDARGAKSMSFDINYIINDAKGINSIYDRLMASVSGTMPTGKTLITYGKLDYILQDFSKSSTNRSDNGFIITAGTLYPITQNLNLNLYAQYYKNSSTVALYDFDKITVMTMISYASGFF